MVSIVQTFSQIDSLAGKALLVYSNFITLIKYPVVETQVWYIKTTTSQFNVRCLPDEADIFI